MNDHVIIPQEEEEDDDEDSSDDTLAFDSSEESLEESSDYFPDLYGENEAILRNYPRSNDGLNPLKIAPLPGCSDEIPRLELMAASQYRGSTNALPQPLAKLVEKVRQIKNLIFGNDNKIIIDAINKSDDDNNRFPKTKNYRLLCASITAMLENINTHPLPDYLSDEISENDVYHYRVSLNGVLCGKIRGPKQITPSFIAWLCHLITPSVLSVKKHKLAWRDYRANAPYSRVFKIPIYRKWYIDNFKVYRFTPIPSVTVLRLFLRQSGYTNKMVLLHITRQINRLI